MTCHSGRIFDQYRQVAMIVVYEVIIVVESQQAPIPRTRFSPSSLFSSQDCIGEKAKREFEEGNLAISNLNQSDCTSKSDWSRSSKIGSLFWFLNRLLIIELDAVICNRFSKVDSHPLSGHTYPTKPTLSH